MQQSSQQDLQKLTPLIKMVKRRQQLYFQMLSFIVKNIESSSTKYEQIGIFNKFLESIKQQETQILDKEKQLLNAFKISLQISQMQISVKKNSKQILRLSSRLLQILQASIQKTRKSIFNDNGRLTLQFTRFKKNLHAIVKGQNIDFTQFVKLIVGYISSKFKRQVNKLQKYIFKLQSGDNIALRDLYCYQKSDNSSPDQKQQSSYRQTQFLQTTKLDHMSSSQSPVKKGSLKRTLKSSSKRGHKLLTMKNLKKQRDSSVNSDTKPPKQYTANKLAKFYGLMEICKKQFLEDYIYEKNEQEEHKKKIMNSLLEKNKSINQQITSYYKKSMTFLDKIHQIEIDNFAKSSGEQKEKADTEEMRTTMSRNTLRKSFIISKRKSSLTFENYKTQKILTENQLKKDEFSKTIKNFTPRRKSTSQSNSKSQNKSKRLFVIKAPVMFVDDNIPAISTTTMTHSFRPPLTNRKVQRKGQNLRLKKRNNPLPMQKSLFTDTFKFSQEQL